MRISGLSLVPVSVALAAVLFALSACGGGGGGSSIRVTEQTITQASYGISQTLGVINSVNDIAGSGAFWGNRGRQYGECPQVRPFSNGFELDFGSGCLSPYLGFYARGKMILSFSGAVIGDNNQLTDFDEIQVQFQNFSTSESEAESGAYNGSITIRNNDHENAVTLTMNLRVNHSSTCSEQFSFSGTITYTEGWFDDNLTLQGTGTYQSSVYGNYSVEFNNLVYNASCDYPVGGNIRITAGGFVALVSFAESSCGIGFASLNNQSPVEFNLEELSDLYSPCGS